MIKKRTRRKPSDQHYVDNKEFYKAMVAYLDEVKAAKLDNKPIPPLTEYIGKCLLDIAQHLSFKGNFVNYTYREEMVSDAVENCLKCVTNFDTDRFTNPFAYFTRVAFQAFVRRIQKEKKSRYEKLISIEDFISNNLGVEEYKEIINSNMEMSEVEREFINKFETSLDEKKKKRRTRNKPLNLLQLFY